MPSPDGVTRACGNGPARPALWIRARRDGCAVRRVGSAVRRNGPAECRNGPAAGLRRAKGLSGCAREVAGRRRSGARRRRQVRCDRRRSSACWRLAERRRPRRQAVMPGGVVGAGGCVGRPRSAGRPGMVSSRSACRPGHPGHSRPRSWGRSVAPVTRRTGAGPAVRTHAGRRGVRRWCADLPGRARRRPGPPPPRPGRPGAAP